MTQPPLPRASAQTLAVVLLVAGALRIGACVAIEPTPLLNDELLYHGLPAKVAAGASLGDAGGRAPGVVLFHTALYATFGAAVGVARAGNVVLSWLSVGLVFLLGRRLAGDRAGLFAAALAAGYPVLIAFSHYLYSETLYVFLLLAGLVTLTGAGPQPGGARAAAAGALFGLCALTREVGLAVPVVAAAGLLWNAVPRPRGGMRPAAILIAATALTIAPWTFYVNTQSEHFALLSRTTWLNLYLGNHEGAHWTRYQEFGADRSAREQAAREIAVAEIRQRLPAWPLEKTFENVPKLLMPTAFPVRRLLQRPETEAKQPGVLLGSWAYRFRWPFLAGDGVRYAAALAVALAYVAVLLPGAAGLALARDRRLSALLIAVALAHAVPVILAFANTRFRLPVMPLLMVGAGALLASPVACWRDASRLQRGGALCAVGLLLICLGVERAALLSRDAF